MASWFFLILLGLVASGVDGYPAEDLILKLPGQPKVSFRQFAGYVDVDEKKGRSLFYYFAEAEEDAEKKPLTLWLNGGPGCSSVGAGAFAELGPFNPRGDGRGLQKNIGSWNKASNLLFVDSPAGVGWSYSNTSSDYITGDAATAKDMYAFLIRWYEKFPEFKSRDLFLTGQSYAGHFIPTLATVLLNHNKHSTAFKFNIKGVALGNPLLKAISYIPSIYQFYWSHGMISDEIYLAIMNQCDFENYVVLIPRHNVTHECHNAISEANKTVGEYISKYDVLLDVCNASIANQELLLGKSATKISLGVDVCILEEFVFYFNLPEVQHAFHANTTSLPYSYSTCSDVINYNGIDGNTNMVPLVKTIIQNGIPVWIFSGDQDATVPLTGSRTPVRELAHDLKFNVTVPYSAWFYKGQVGGWATEYGNLLTFATVRGGGHMPPYAQPERTLLLFKSFVSGKRLPNTAHPVG